MKNSYAVIMAGGVGSRYWPVSRSNHPKQFIDILGTGKSLIRQTFERFVKRIPAENIFVVTNEKYKKLVNEQIPEIADSQILLEPVGKNTAPCIAYACYRIHAQDANASIIISPSDHLILDDEKFFASLQTAVDFSKNGTSLVTIGIMPNRPDTGYGYIQYHENKEKQTGVFKVKTFTEKPDLELAKTFLASGDFLWNAGIFIFRSDSIINAFEKFVPELHHLFLEGKDKLNTSREAEFINEIYPRCPNISIDYAVMEKSPNVHVVPGDFGWNDLGTWNSLYDIMEKDEQGNAVVGDKIHLYESSGNILNFAKNKLVVLKGVNDMIVVEADNILLICGKELEQEVKQIVTDIRLKYGEKYI